MNKTLNERIETLEKEIITLFLKINVIEKRLEVKEHKTLDERMLSFGDSEIDKDDLKLIFQSFLNIIESKEYTDIVKLKSLKHIIKTLINLCDEESEE